MAQILAALISTLVLAGAMALIAAMLRDEADRVLAIISGRELARARTAPLPRIRVRAWPRTELRPAPLRQRAAA